MLYNSARWEQRTTMGLCNVNRITGTEKGEDEISYLAPESNVDSI
jgi:hypothetical protein